MRNMKKGVTISVMVVAVVIMLIILSSATVIGINAINTANYEEFMSKISRVTDTVHSFVSENKDLPISSYEVISKENLAPTLVAKLEENNDVLNDLYVINMSKVNTANVNIGGGNTNDKNVFLVAENSNNVYYYKGFKYKNKWYYGI